MITVIAPHARPRFASNLLSNFRRQEDVEARLLVVENGPAIGASWPSDVSVIRASAHQADAMNAGLAWITSAGYGPWARFDDDDYYGPGYLASVVGALELAPVVGKTWGFVMFDDGLYRFAGTEHGACDVLTGGTLAARSADVAPFQRRPDDDVQWCRDMRARGASLWASSHRDYCYDRRAERHGEQRVITTSPLITRWGFGAAEYHGDVPIQYVDAPHAALRPAPPPTDAEMMAALSL